MSYNYENNKNYINKKTLKKIRLILQTIVHTIVITSVIIMVKHTIIKSKRIIRIQSLAM